MNYWFNEDKTIQLCNGDCLDIMDKLIEMGIRVDAIITDPPYGTTSCKWDTIIPIEEMWKRLKNIRYDNTPIVLFGSEPFSSLLRCSNLKEYRYDWVWDKKKQGAIGIAKYQPLRYTENISVFYKKTANYYPIMVKRDKIKISKNYKHSEMNSKYIKEMENNKEYTEKYPSNIIEISNANQKGKFHSTQKPVELMKYLIKTYTKENDLVLDFTMGVGSTGLACKELNRRFIGIELDEKYFDIAVKRIKGEL